MSISLLRDKIQQYFFNYPEEEEIIAQVFEFLDNVKQKFSGGGGAPPSPESKNFKTGRDQNQSIFMVLGTVF